jgi:hypothetical protein
MVSVVRPAVNAKLGVLLPNNALTATPGRHGFVASKGAVVARFLMGVKAINGHDLSETIQTGDGVAYEQIQFETQRGELFVQVAKALKDEFIVLGGGIG